LSDLYADYPQYISIQYTERLAEAGLEASVGSRGDSYDNALAEIVIGLSKTEVMRQTGAWARWRHDTGLPRAWLDHRGQLLAIPNRPGEVEVAGVDSWPAPGAGSPEIAPGRVRRSEEVADLGLNGPAEQDPYKGPPRFPGGVSGSAQRLRDGV
jgi:transposase InsO family protein